MALAKTPEQLGKESDSRRAVADRENDDLELSQGLTQGITQHGDARDGSHPQVIALRNTLRGWHWQGYQRVFQILEMVCGTDRMFDRARKQVLDVANDQERSMVAIVNRMAAPQVKEKEQKDAGTESARS